jgi:hypothetical protein
MIYELYNPIINKVIGLFKTETECHIAAKSLSVYEITVCTYSINGIKRIKTTRYEAQT